jgi:hypothetical protein
MTTTSTKARKKPMYERGDYIYLNWEDTPREEYVRGHVTSEEFAAAFNAYHWGDDVYQAPPPASVKHEYARWEMSGYGEYGNGGRVMATHSTPGPGKFPITTVPYGVMWPDQYWVETPAEHARWKQWRRTPDYQIEWLASLPTDAAQLLGESSKKEGPTDG